MELMKESYFLLRSKGLDLSRLWKNEFYYIDRHTITNMGRPGHIRLRVRWTANAILVQDIEMEISGVTSGNTVT